MRVITFNSQTGQHHSTRNRALWRDPNSGNHERFGLREEAVPVGRELLVGAVILLNGVEQNTRNDDQNPQTILIGKKAGKKIKAGDSLQVRNPNGSLSDVFIYTGS